MPHAFKSRACTYNGKPFTIVRGANSGDVSPKEAEAVMKAAHFLLEDAKGARTVVPAGSVTILPEPETEQ